MLPLRKIICATDFSEPAQWAWRRADELAAHFGAEVLLLHVAAPLPPLAGLSAYPGVAAPDMSGYEEAVSAQAEREMNALLAMKSDGVQARFEVRWGDAPATILATAAHEKADLIVMSSHGQGGWRRQVFGSVAEKVLRQSACPVLVVPAGEKSEDKLLPMTAIVAPTDFSEPSHAVLDVAGEWAAHFDAELYPLHVVAPLHQPGVIVSRARLEESVQADAVQKLYALVAERLPQVKKTHPIARRGRVAEQIADVAVAHKAQLIVISTHGAGGWQILFSGTAIDHALFGSVASNVLRLAMCPVLVLREKA